jgi:hypothetical protein
MKTIATLFVTLLISISSFSQNGINYKAVVKDHLGNVIANSSIDVLFAILEGVAQTNVYQETHTTTSDANGIIIVNIGEGSQVSGNYNNIDWGNDEHFLYVLIDIGNGWVDMGTTEFKSVPYAIHALNAANATGLEAIDEGLGIGWRLKGKDIANYGFIGLNAVDLSDSFVPSSTLGATGNYSLAMGLHTTASGSNAMASGFETHATGTASVATGSSTLASGNSSTAMGNWTIASGSAATAIGSYNIDNSNALFSVGNGSGSANRNNAFTVLQNGNAGIGISSPIDLLHLHSATNSHIKFTRSATGSSYNDGFLVGYSGNNDNFIWSYENNDIFFGTNNNYRMTITNNGNVGIGINSGINGRMEIASASGLTSPQLYLHETTTGYTRLNFSNANRSDYWAIGAYIGATSNDDRFNFYNSAVGSDIMSIEGSGNVRVNGAIVHASDMRLKNNIEELSYGLDEIMQLDPKEYHWNTKPNQKDKSIGLIAQDVQKIIKEIVHADTDEEKTLSISYTELIPVLIKALQEQQSIIENQNMKINMLTTELDLKDEESKAFDNRLKQIENQLKISSQQNN